jgi:putative glutamine amidotransferase
LIGLPCTDARRDTIPPRFGVNAAYIAALERAGAAPILIPIVETVETLQAILSRLDGLLLPGGGDVDPPRYGEVGLPGLNQVQAETDRVELMLAHAALETDLPLLGVCRGQQLLNVAMGGTLYQDLQKQEATALDHTGSRPHGRDFLFHSVRIAPDSRLASLLGAIEVEVNSLHHQGIKGMAPGLRAVAWSPDGVIEAVEGEGAFRVAVQWHPEELPHQPAAARLFEGFVAACQRTA